MIFQSLDIKENCKGTYEASKLHLDQPTPPHYRGFTKTWKHVPSLDDEKYTFLFLLSKDNRLRKYSPDSDKYDEIERVMAAHKKAALTSKIELKGSCFLDMIPDHVLLSWLSERHSCLCKIDRTLQPPSDYDILHKAHVLTSEIGRQDLMFENKKGRVQYNIFGSATGRLTTKKGSVPIMTLKKEDRYKITPQNDAFVELDLNAAEIRTLMALSGREQPQEDIHEWVVENVFNGEIERSKAKIELFAWLYNPSSSKSQFDKFFSRQIFRDFFAPEDQTLKTPFGRVLAVNERKAQNYLLQSTTSDIVIQNAYKIMKMLEGKKSKIAFTLHDSIIIDMCKKDAIMLRKIKKQFEETPWGPFISTCKIGKTFGDLKDLKI